MLNKCIIHLSQLWRHDYESVLAQSSPRFDSNLGKLKIKQYNIKIKLEVMYNLK